MCQSIGRPTTRRLPTNYKLENDSNAEIEKIKAKLKKQGIDPNKCTFEKTSHGTINININISFGCGGIPGPCGPKKNPNNKVPKEGKLKAAPKGWPKNTVETSGGYKIVNEGNTKWSIYGPKQKPGEKPLTRVSGDPHVYEKDDNGKKSWDFTKDSQFVLPDGTRITCDTTSEKGRSISQKLLISNGSHAMEMGGVRGGKPTMSKVFQKGDPKAKAIFAATARGATRATMGEKGESKGNLLDAFRLDPKSNNTKQEWFKVEREFESLDGFAGKVVTGAEYKNGVYEQKLGKSVLVDAKGNRGDNKAYGLTQGNNFGVQNNNGRVQIAGIPNRNQAGGLGTQSHGNNLSAMISQILQSFLAQMGGQQRGGQQAVGQQRGGRQQSNILAGMQQRGFQTQGFNPYANSPFRNNKEGVSQFEQRHLRRQRASSRSPRMNDFNRLRKNRNPYKMNLRNNFRSQQNQMSPFQPRRPNIGNSMYNQNPQMQQFMQIFQAFAQMMQKFMGQMNLKQNFQMPQRRI